MAAKGQSVEVVNELISSKPDLINMLDSKGNTALHIATRKGRTKVNRLNIQLVEYGYQCDCRLLSP